MEEKEFLREGKMLVTSTHIDIGGHTFATRNIGSVKTNKGGAPWFAAIIALFAIGLVFNENTRWAGVIVAGAAAAWIYQKVTQRTLVLVSGGGETIALKSRNGAMVERVRSAIASAISAR